MSPVAYIAQLLGIYTVLIGGVMFVRRQAMLEIMTAIIDRRPLIFILANLRVLIGLAIVLTDNRWSGALAIVVTLIGWITLLRGIALALLPADAERKVFSWFKRTPPYYGAATVAIVLGLRLRPTSALPAERTVCWL